jgi:hypothetical protein
MEQDAIKEIGIDVEGRLYIKPQNRKFPFIYLEAMEVHWDRHNECLFTPPPPRGNSASPTWWFRQIIAAAKEQNCKLHIESGTAWHNISDQLKIEISSINTGIYE